MCQDREHIAHVLSQITSVNQAELALKYACMYNNFPLAKGIMHTYSKLINYLPALSESVQGHRLSMTYLILSFYSPADVLAKTCREGEIHTTKFILAHLIISPEQKTQAFMDSCQYGHLSLAQLIYSFGVEEINIDTALSVTTSLPILEWLLDHDADPEFALYHACSKGLSSFLPLLFLSNPSPSNIELCLSRAARFGHLEMVMYLVDTAKAHELEWALAEAKTGNHYSIQVWLIRAMIPRYSILPILGALYTYPRDQDILHFFLCNGLERRWLESIPGIDQLFFILDQDLESSTIIPSQPLFPNDIPPKIPILHLPPSTLSQEPTSTSTSTSTSMMVSDSNDPDQEWVTVSLHDEPLTDCEYDIVSK